MIRSCAGILSTFLLFSVASCSDDATNDNRAVRDGLGGATGDMPAQAQAGEMKKVGAMTITQTTNIRLPGGGGSGHAGVGVSFNDEGRQMADGYSRGRGDIYHRCTHTDLGGGCSYFQCTGVLPGFVQHSAGTLSVTGGHSSITMRYQGDNYGLQVDPPFEGWDFFGGGTPLVFRAEGSNEIPAFEARINGPTDLILTHPTFEQLPDGNPDSILDLDPGSPAEFVWNSPDSGIVRVEIYHRQENSLNADDGISCDYPGVTKAGTISRDVLDRVSQKESWIQVQTIQNSVVHTGEYDVRVSAATEGKSPEGYLFPRNLHWKTEAAP